MPKNIKLRLVLDLELDPAGHNKEQVKRELGQGMHRVLQRGILTAGLDATVEDYKYTVEEVTK